MANMQWSSDVAQEKNLPHKPYDPLNPKRRRNKIDDCLKLKHNCWEYDYDCSKALEGEAIEYVWKEYRDL
jgi:hypothetical protein